MRKYPYTHAVPRDKISDATKGGLLLAVLLVLIASLFVMGSADYGYDYSADQFDFCLAQPEVPICLTQQYSALSY